MQAKRKTHTSSEVKRRYNEKHYKRFSADIKIEFFNELAEYIEREGLSRSEFLAKAFEALKDK
jgi:hypothetical protein